MYSSLHLHFLIVPVFYREPAALVDSLSHALGLRAKDLRNKLGVGKISWVCTW